MVGSTCGLDMVGSTCGLDTVGSTTGLDMVGYNIIHDASVQLCELEHASNGSCDLQPRQGGKASDQPRQGGQCVTGAGVKTRQGGDQSCGDTNSSKTQRDNQIEAYTCHTDGNVNDTTQLEQLLVDSACHGSQPWQADAERSSATGWPTAGESLRERRCGHQGQEEVTSLVEGWNGQQGGVAERQDGRQSRNGHGESAARGSNSSKNWTGSSLRAGVLSACLLIERRAATTERRARAASAATTERRDRAASAAPSGHRARAATECRDWADSVAPAERHRRRDDDGRGGLKAKADRGRRGLRSLVGRTRRTWGEGWKPLSRCAERVRRQARRQEALCPTTLASRGLVVAPCAPQGHETVPHMGERTGTRGGGLPLEAAQAGSRGPGDVREVSELGRRTSEPANDAARHAESWQRGRSRDCSEQGIRMGEMEPAMGQLDQRLERRARRGLYMEDRVEQSQMGQPRLAEGEMGQLNLEIAIEVEATGRRGRGDRLQRIPLVQSGLEPPNAGETPGEQEVHRVPAGGRQIGARHQTVCCERSSKVGQQRSPRLRFRSRPCHGLSPAAVQAALAGAREDGAGSHHQGSQCDEHGGKADCDSSLFREADGEVEGFPLSNFQDHLRGAGLHMGWRQHHELPDCHPEGHSRIRRNTGVETRPEASTGTREHLQAGGLSQQVELSMRRLPQRAKPTMHGSIESAEFSDTNGIQLKPRKVSRGLGSACEARGSLLNVINVVGEIEPLPKKVSRGRGLTESEAKQLSDVSSSSQMPESKVPNRARWRKAHSLSAVMNRIKQRITSYSQDSLPPPPQRLLMRFAMMSEVLLPG